VRSGRERPEIGFVSNRNRVGLKQCDVISVVIQFGSRVRPVEREISPPAGASLRKSRAGVRDDAHLIMRYRFKSRDHRYFTLLVLPINETADSSRQKEGARNDKTIWKVHLIGNKNGPISGARFQEAKMVGMSGKAMQHSVPKAGTVWVVTRSIESEGHRRVCGLLVTFDRSTCGAKAGCSEFVYGWSIEMNDSARLRPGIACPAACLEEIADIPKCITMHIQCRSLLRCGT
jgi:hypothetical protein